MADATPGGTLGARGHDADGSAAAPTPTAPLGSKPLAQAERPSYLDLRIDPPPLPAE